MPKGYANIFVPDDLKERIDGVQGQIGLRSRTDVVRVGVYVLERMIVELRKQWMEDKAVAGWVSEALREMLCKDDPE